MAKESYFIVYQWMSDKDGLALKGNELLVYAVIYSLCRKSNRCFAKQEYIGRLIGIDRPQTVGDCINRLTQKGYIIKNKTDENTTEYRINTDCINKHTSEASTNENRCRPSTESVTSTNGKRCEPSTESVTVTNEKRCHNNKYNNKYLKITVKEREENKKPLPSGDVIDLILQWFEYRESIGKAVDNEKSIAYLSERIINACSEYGIEKVKELIEYSISNKYFNIYFERLQNEPALSTAPKKDNSPSYSNELFMKKALFNL